MELLWRELADAAVVSIGHRAELARFHDRRVVLVRGHGGARLVGDLHVETRHKAAQGRA
jgi:putative ATP-binding cassette transporter